MPVPHPTVTSHDSVALGQFGADFIGNSALTIDGDWVAIKAQNGDASFSTLTGTSFKVDGGATIGATNNLVNLTIRQGDIIFGRFSRIKIAGAAVIAYRATPFA